MRMANVNAPDNQNAQNPSTNNISPPYYSIGANTATMHVSETIPSMESSIPTHLISHTEPILTYIGPRGPPHTPPPIGNIPNRPLVPPGFSIPVGGREQLYGMPTSVMASLHNAGSTFLEPVVNINSPIQGCGVNMGQNNQSSGLRHHTQILSLTNNFAVVWRQ